MSTPTPLVPVFGASGCAGHILRTAYGFRAFDASDKQIGYFEDSNSAISALLELANQTTEKK
jgi:hypothetical protein